MSDSLQPHGLHSPWNSTGQNAGVGSLSFLQRIFLTQELNQGLLYCRRILYLLSHHGSLCGNYHHLSAQKGSQETKCPWACPQGVHGALLDTLSMRWPWDPQRWCSLRTCDKQARHSQPSVPTPRHGTVTIYAPLHQSQGVLGAPGCWEQERGNSLI